MTKSRGIASDPSYRKARARKAALASNLERADPAAAARAKSPAVLAYWLDKVDPERKLPERERSRRAKVARQLHFASLQLKAQEARARKRSDRAE